MSEGLCLRCGRCCQASVRSGAGRIQVPELACKHLTPESLCAVYETRHEVAPWCLTLEKAIEDNIFPPDCPYVEGLEGYAGARETPLYPLLRSELQEALAADGVPPWVDPAAWATYLAS